MKLKVTPYGVKIVKMSFRVPNIKHNIISDSSTGPKTIEKDYNVAEVTYLSEGEVE